MIFQVSPALEKVLAESSAARLRRDQYAREAQLILAAALQDMHIDGCVKDEDALEAILETSRSKIKDASNAGSSLT